LHAFLALWTSPAAGPCDRAAECLDDFVAAVADRFLTDVRYEADRVLNIAVHELLHPPWPQGHPVKDSLDHC
jgi:hypothetical protein